MSERAAARRFGLARETVRKMLRYSVPPGYRRAQPVRCPKLDGFTGVIDQILGDDQQRPKKHRHTAKRIWERLRAEHAFTGGYTIVKDYVRAKTLGGQEMFVPLAHPPGDAPADVGEALVVIAGVECKAHYLVVDLPQPPRRPEASLRDAAPPAGWSTFPPPPWSTFAPPLTLEAVKGFRRLKGCGDMPRLVSALRARDQRLGLGVSEVNVA